MEIVLFWYRRDLRIYDNAGLYQALKASNCVLPVFIFDPEILNPLSKEDRRVPFIYQTVIDLKTQFQGFGSDLQISYDKPLEAFKKLAQVYKIKAIYSNEDYEPSAIQRDLSIQKWAKNLNIDFLQFKDQVIFSKGEVFSDQKKPYTVYTPYKKKWISQLNSFYLKSYPVELYLHHLLKISDQNKQNHFPTLTDMGFSENSKNILSNYPDTELSTKLLKKYKEERDYPALNGTSRLGIHLRFGTLSVRELAREAQKHSEVWLSELIWREFFMQILWHFPHVVKGSFRSEYDQIKWRNSEEEINRWKTGQTGYVMVDAGIRELLATGHMHNRVRMVVASFLTKHLLVHWSIGERFFAEHLLDYDLSANNGNWQWAAGTGCDAAPYFRVFNPESQLEKFDTELSYVKKWVPEYGTSNYVKPMVDHVFARNRALAEYKKGLKK